MNKFKVGDKVYYPAFSTQVLEIKSNVSSSFPLRISSGYSSESFTKDGYVDSHTESTSIVLATQENKELLDKLYDIEFQPPPPKTVSVTLEIPEPFEPKLSEVYWYLDNWNEVDFSIFKNDLCDHYIKCKWRTKEEATQALTAFNATFGIPL